MRRLLTTIGVVLACTGACFGTVTYYTAVDLGTGTGAFPNSSAEQATFLAAITGQPTFNITFEGLTQSNAATQVIDGVTFTCGTCSTSSPPNGPGVTSVDGFPTFDGFNTTSGGSQFYRSEAHNFSGTNTLTLTFSQPTTFFGAYFTGVENACGTTAITFNDGAAETSSLADSTSGGTCSGGNAGTQFWGFRTTGSAVSSITFTTTNTSSNRDLWGIDDIATFGTPEPSAAFLTAVGLGGLFVLRLRRKITRT